MLKGRLLQRLLQLGIGVGILLGSSEISLGLETATPESKCVIEKNKSGKQVREIEDNLFATHETAKIYPSLTPRSYIQVGYGHLLDDPTTYEPPAAQVPGTWLLRKTGEATLFSPEKVEILEHAGEKKGVAYLILKPHTVKKGDKLVVCMKVMRKGNGSELVLLRNKGIVDVKSDPDSYTLRIEPTTAPNQQLNDGTKKTVGQFQLKLDVPSLIPDQNIARFYLKSENLFSTASEDKTSKVDIKAGAMRSLLPSWYVPWGLEGRLIGNQTFKNGSFIASARAATILPWKWSSSFLFNDAVKAPVSPEFDLAAQYERRFEQDQQAVMSHANEDSFRLFGQVAWNPIHLLPGKGFTARDITLEMLAKGWWFPDEKTNMGNRVSKLEGRLEVSLVVPLAGLNLSGIFIKAPIEGTGSRLRIKYSDGANEANGFTHSSEFTLSVEVLK